jgi:uncharacterized protein YhbP (UPF0306 family)
MGRDPRALALQYLANHQVMTLATRTAADLWAAAVFYASDRFHLYFLSAGHTRHARHIAANPRVAATIQEDYRDWPAIQGIQLEGEVARLEGDARRKALAIYRDRYPFIAGAGAELQQALARVNWYRLTPTRLYFIDNSQGLGHRDEVELPAG